jgi:hypothetical protein
MFTRLSQVTLEEATAKAQGMNLMFMETSAKAGHNVKSLFKKIAMSLPGMEKEGAATDAQNTSMFSSSPGHPLRSCISRDRRDHTKGRCTRGERLQVLGNCLVYNNPIMYIGGVYGGYNWLPSFLYICHIFACFFSQYI